MNNSNKPRALLLVSSHCPHCHALEALLKERKSNGVLDQLDIVNIEKSPQEAQQHGVRSVPWLLLDDFVFDSAMTPAELDGWIEHAREGTGRADYIVHLLEHGELNNAIKWIEQGKAELKVLIPVLKNPDEKMNVRVGLGAIMEHYEGTQAIRDIIPELIGLMQSDHAMIRVDACHYLSLTHSMDIIESLMKMLDDENEQVREVARESIDDLRLNS